MRLAKTGRARLAVSAAALLSIAASAAEARDIKVCLLAAKTGPFEAYAKQTEAGFMMGIEYLTKGTGKVGDDKIEVIVKDDQLKPDRGKSLLEECYGDDKADIAVGTSGSPVALAMLPVAEERKKVLIVEPAVADSITGDKWNRYIFRTGRSSYQDALAAAAAIPANEETSIGMLGLDTAFGRDGVKAYKDALASIRPKAKIVAEEYAAGNTADFAPFAAMNADPVVMEHFPSVQTQEESEAAARRIMARIESQGWGNWAVEVIGGEPFIGFTGLSVPTFEERFVSPPRHREGAIELIGDPYAFKAEAGVGFLGVVLGSVQATDFARDLLGAQ